MRLAAPRARVKVAGSPVQMAPRPGGAGGLGPAKPPGWAAVHDGYPPREVTGKPYAFASALSETHWYSYLENGGPAGEHVIDRWDYPAFSTRERVYTFPALDSLSGTPRQPLLAYLDGRLWWARHDRGLNADIVEGGPVSSLPITAPTTLTIVPNDWTLDPFRGVRALVALPASQRLFMHRWYASGSQTYPAGSGSELVELFPAAPGTAVVRHVYPSGDEGLAWLESTFTADAHGGIWGHVFTVNGYEGPIVRYDTETGVFARSDFEVPDWVSPAFFAGTGDGTLLYVDGYSLVYEVGPDMERFRRPDLEYTTFWRGEPGVMFGDGPSVCSPSHRVAWVQDTQPNYTYPGYDGRGEHGRVVELAPNAQNVLPGDNFSDAGDLSAWSSGWVAGSTTWAEVEAAEPIMPAGDAASSSVWYRWDAPYGCLLEVATSGDTEWWGSTHFTSVVEIFRGDDLISLERLAWNDGTVLTVDVEGDPAYTAAYVQPGPHHIRVSGWQGDYGGFALWWEASSGHVDNATHTAVGDTHRDGTGLITRRVVDDQGERWEAQRTPFDASSPNFVIADGPNAVIGGFIYHGVDWNYTDVPGLIYTTDGGRTWAPADSAFAGGQNTWTSNGAAGTGRFVAGGFFDNDHPGVPAWADWGLVSVSSTDPSATWDVGYLSTGNFYWLTFVDGLFVAGGISAQTAAGQTIGPPNYYRNILLQSEDGITWTELPCPFPYVYNNGNGRVDLLGLASDGTTWVMVGRAWISGTSIPTAYRSTDRATWTAHGPIAAPLHDIRHAKGVFVGIASRRDRMSTNPTPPYQPCFYWSADGLQWAAGSPDPFATPPAQIAGSTGQHAWVERVDFDGDLFFVGGTAQGTSGWPPTTYDPYCVSVKSDDGKAWTEAVPAAWKERPVSEGGWGQLGDYYASVYSVAKLAPQPPDVPTGRGVAAVGATAQKLQARPAR